MVYDAANMNNDCILEPMVLADLIRGYLDGVIDGLTASYRALRLAGSTDRILAGHQTPVAVAAYWSLRRLAESTPTRPTDDDLRFLLDCIEGRRRDPRA